MKYKHFYHELCPYWTYVSETISVSWLCWYCRVHISWPRVKGRCKNGSRAQILIWDGVHNKIWCIFRVWNPFRVCQPKFPAWVNHRNFWWIRARSSDQVTLITSWTPAPRDNRSCRALLAELAVKMLSFSLIDKFQLFIRLLGVYLIENQTYGKV